MSRWISVTVVAFMMFVMIPIAVMSNASQQAQADDPIAAPAVNCSQARISPTQVRITCTAAGVVVLSTVVNLPKVPAPPPVTVTIPVPGGTQTVRVPGPTVRIPGPTSTVTKTAPGGTRTIKQPGATVTVTRSAAPETVGPSELPSPSKQTSEPTRQPTTTSGTIEPDSTDEDQTFLSIPGADLSAPETVGLGLLSIIGLVALVILGMWIGYYMGYKDSDKAEAKFLKSLLGR